MPDVVQLQYDVEDKYQTMFNDIALNEDEFVTLYQSGKNMKNKLIIGRYLPNNSVIHRLDPRAKLIFVFVFIIFIFCSFFCYICLDNIINSMFYENG